jgi:hypothetical protein
MKRLVGEFLLCGILVSAGAGCEPRPVIVNPDNDGDTTVIDDDADVSVVPDGTITQPETGVDVRIGGGEGVDVKVTPPEPGSNQ